MSDTGESALDPQQERAAYMLATGAGVQEVADELDVHRSTLWDWRQQATFQAFYNRLLSEIRADVKEGLVGLYEEAVDTVRECLNSEDERVALKAASQVIERVEALEPGSTDPHAILRQRHTSTLAEDMEEMMGMTDQSFDREGYEKDCEELGIEPE
jgi:transposase-like protein